MVGEEPKKVNFFSRFNFLAKIREGQRVKAETQRQAQIEKKVTETRKTLSGIEEDRVAGGRGPEDDVREETALDTLEQLGQESEQGKWTPDEIQRKAVLVATREANEAKRPLTENDVIRVKARLMDEAKNNQGEKKSK